MKRQMFIMKTAESEIGLAVEKMTFPPDLSSEGGASAREALRKQKPKAFM
ncbi:MAG: hypothetical protein NZ989_01975 [Bacteroidia bacterium]|nr:hypothetical protein [Bacteroidia bacterium]MDW8056881.1 hypothetical protein [Bacteroidia bacterium]